MGWDEEYMVTLYFVSFEIKEQIVTRIQKRIKPLVNVSTLSADNKLISVHVYLLLQGYTNADNPFGDEHLLDTFVWSKKLEREGKKHIPMSEIQRMQKAKLIESKVFMALSTGISQKSFYTSDCKFARNVHFFLQIHKIG